MPRAASRVPHAKIQEVLAIERYNVLVLMEKEKDTGILTQTVDSYTIEEGIELIENAYLTEEDEGYFTYITLTTSDIEDWQYYGIYDLYDEDIFEELNAEVLDGSGEYNPQWVIKVRYIEERSEMEGIINSIVKLHHSELERIMPLVEADRQKYMEEAEKEE